MSERLLTPSKITSWLGCAHSLTLSNAVSAGALRLRPNTLSDLAEVLIEKGGEHERACLEDYEAMGRHVYQVPGRNVDESFEAWVARVGDPLSLDVDVIYQMPFIHDGIRGIADFLVRVRDPEEGFAHFEPVDAKLTRTKAKPGHVLQLCFYAEAMTALLGRAPKRMHLWLGSGSTQELLVEEFLPYWRRLRVQLQGLLEEDASASITRPRLCDTCEYCEYFQHCEGQWREEDSLTFVANSRPEERERLEAAGVRTMVALAGRRESVERLRDERLSRLVNQANLQMASRATPDAPPRFEVIEPGDDPNYGRGFEQMPEPDGGDVFFDFEGDPFWTPQHDLMFLAGLYYRDDAGEWTYDERWAHTLHDQQLMIRGLMEFFRDRRERFPKMHVYHYNHTERSTMERLMNDADDANLFASLDESGLFVDLFVVARNAVRVGVESYGLKHLEPLVGFVRGEGIDQGAGAVVEYEKWLKDPDDEILIDIARYNRDDVASTLALRDWLVSQRPAALAWRDAFVTNEVYQFDTDELVEQLHEFDVETPQYLLGDLLNYWRRERTADMTPRFAALDSDAIELVESPDFVVGLEFVRVEEPKGRERNRALVFTFPEQPLDPKYFSNNQKVAFSSAEQAHGLGSLRRLDVEARELAIVWGAFQEEVGTIPRNLTCYEDFAPGSKLAALKDLARQVLDPVTHGEPSRLSMALLEAERPRFRSAAGPRDATFSDELEDIYEWVGELDESFVSFQGPPGTGKTYSGSHVIYHLIKAGLRVGVVSTGNLSIDHLMSAAYEVFQQHDDVASLEALRWWSTNEVTLDFATYAKKAEFLTTDRFNLIGGTSWLWSRAELRQLPVDVLVVDEAGQLSLADAVAATNGARNMLLLGDPLQLAHVSKAVHPNGSGASVLEHLLGENVTIPDDEGVFMSESRRMHPDVCRFISNQIYEGRLTSHESCQQQNTALGTGLRWLRARHEERSTESPEEAKLVVEQVRAMVGTTWTNQAGVQAELGAKDFMVVAPYNDQVRLLRDALETAGLHGVQVGTVDKFQGREAPVVFFTMTTSSAQDMPRGPEFLFSRNRLNVAVSRARCLAFLVCTEELLNSRAADLEGMRLISTLCAFVEYAQESVENASV
ncbi:MAG TPA: TM0106 family RecB-like putative nuclease [Acidimicrobiales bacterium]|nr:TM0106 family RecB-like putative nuclease [Acidimicrobiales bacterium]